MKARTAQGVWARWGLLASTFVLGAALIIASWANDRAARDASAAIHLGQAGVLFGAVRQSFRGHAPGEEPAGLDSVLADRYAEGLRYVAFFGATGEVSYAVGVPSGVPMPVIRQSDREDIPRLSRAGSRVRAVFLHGPRPPFPSDRGLKETPPPASEHREDLRVGGGIVIEFEPVVAHTLVQRAARLRAFGIAAAAVMMLAAAVFWRFSRRYETAMRHLEQERRLSLLGEMTAVLAHEIRNPLASLKGNAQLLAERLEASPPERAKADLVVSEAARLETLTADLLDFARTGPLDIRATDPGDLARACAREVAPAGFELALERAPERWMMDGPRMRQALTNLLRNAHQASEGAKVSPRVEVFVEAGALTFSVRDHGVGLPQGQEDRIFDPFFTTRATGTGLGLAVARRIVELHGGAITAANRPDGGAEIRIALPGARDA